MSLSSYVQFLTTTTSTTTTTAAAATTTTTTTTILLLLLLLQYYILLLFSVFIRDCWRMQCFVRHDALPVAKPTALSQNRTKFSSMHFAGLWCTWRNQSVFLQRFQIKVLSLCSLSEIVEQCYAGAKLPLYEHVYRR